MSKANAGKSNVVVHKGRHEATNARPGSNRSKSVDPSKSRQRLKVITTEPKSLEEWGYFFNNHGRLVSIDDKKPFEFDVYQKKEDNQRRYHAIGRLVDEFIYSMLERNLELRRIPIPLDARTSEPTGFFFASDDITRSDCLMIIIHGMGVVRAGQWSRKLIINENIEVGSQLDYIAYARTNGYAVIVTNTNLNIDESSQSFVNKSRPIRGSESPEEHACYIWENYVRQSPARYICIMAHSYGGAVVLHLAARYAPEFSRRVFAVALTDSPMRAYTNHFDMNVLRMLQKKTINWVADTKKVNTPLGTREYGEIRAAGHGEHEWTSHTARHSIFQFFEEVRQKVKRSTH